jgi:DnaJ-domain-containing protein 1
MTDFFAVLGEPRRPWLEPDLLKEKFLALSASFHPDRVHNLGEAEKQKAQERYAELNAAYNCLREPRSRLRHLLELERGWVPAEIQQIPSDLMDLFIKVGQMMRRADAFLAEKRTVSSPLLKVNLFERGEELAGELRDLAADLNARRKLLLDELAVIDAGWIPSSTARPEALPRLEEIYQFFGFFDRWISQIHERIHQISF